MDISILPVSRLNYNVTQFLSLYFAIDIRDAILTGLKNEIELTEELEGKPINACCTQNGQVCLSPSFAQSVWCMCYAGLKLADCYISAKESVMEGSSLKEIYDAILKNRCEQPECLYIKGMVEAMNWEVMMDEVIAFRRKWAFESDCKKMGSLDITAPFESRVNGMYMAGMGGILLHEMTHFYKHHFDRGKYENRRDLEMEADNVAFDSLLSLPLEYRRSAVLGSLCAYLLAFFNNPNLVANENYYREDIRLFTQYDKIQDKDSKRRANIIVAYVLSRWLKDCRDIEIRVDHNNEEATVAKIREVISAL